MARRPPDGDRLEEHNNYPYAHAAMIGRIMQENVSLRERFENRLKASEDETDNLKTAFERFKGQATLLGGIGLIVLGAVLATVANAIWHIRLVP